MESVVERERRTPVAARAQVLVVGGGPAGLIAAIAAARGGADVLLLERYGFLGGMCTAGYVTFLPIRDMAPRSSGGPLITGVPQDLVRRLIAVGGAVDPAVARRFGVARGIENHFPVDPEMMKLVALGMLEEAGVRLRLHSFVADVVRDGAEMKGVIAESKSGREAFLADVIIDASGDGDVAAHAGAPYERDPKPLGMTLYFYIGNVDAGRARDHVSREELTRMIEEAVQKGDFPAKTERVYPVPGTFRGPYAFGVNLVLPPPEYVERWHRRNEVSVWGAHTRADTIDAETLTRAELATRRQAHVLFGFLKRYVPGFEHSYLMTTATQVGVRESRRIVGDYVLTGDDVMKGATFDDTVARTTCWDAEDQPCYDVPYRVLLPRGVERLLVAGRCISMDGRAAKLLSPREITPCMATGQAAGAAAAVAVKAGLSPRGLDVTLVQEAVRHLSVERMSTIA